MEELRCYGCGAIIQSEDEKKIGFVPKNALDRSQVLCKRCFRLKNYHQLQATNLSDDDFLEILNKIGEKDCLVVYLVDLFDFNGSLFKDWFVILIIMMSLLLVIRGIFYLVQSKIRKLFIGWEDNLN